MTALPSSPLYSSPVPSTYTLRVVTTDIYLHISGYSSARGARHTLRMRTAYVTSHVQYNYIRVLSALTELRANSIYAHNARV